MTCKRRAIVSDHKLEDVIAQSSCAAYMSHNPVEFVYAVRRVCSNTSPTCAQVCSNQILQAQDIQTASSNTWTCIGAIHVYYGRPATGDGEDPTLGLKQYYFGHNKCNQRYCGPNYCCCRVTVYT